MTKMETKSNRGGARPNSGRPKTNRPHKITIKISEAAYEKWKQMENRTDKMERFILEQ